MLPGNESVRQSVNNEQWAVAVRDAGLIVKTIQNKMTFASVWIDRQEDVERERVSF